MLCQESNDPCGVLQALNLTLKFKREKTFISVSCQENGPYGVLQALHWTLKLKRKKNFTVLCQENGPCGVLQALHWTLKLKTQKKTFQCYVKRTTLVVCCRHYIGR